MPRFAANLSFLYQELPFLDRFEAAARDGFKAVEYLFPYAWPASEISARLRDNDLQQALFNAPPGGTDVNSFAAAWDSGTRGIACLPGREAQFRTGFSAALRAAEALSCRQVHVMAGLAPAEAKASDLQAAYVKNLRWAAGEAAKDGLDVLIEPINTRDMPGFYLSRQAAAHAVIAEAGASNLKVQMDLYHCQIMEGDLAMQLRQYLPTGAVGHLQIAGVPERNEPDTGEINYAYLFALIDRLEFPGWIGCEYRPADNTPGGTSRGLGWMRAATTPA
jgi:hydroxypyruvate isomerase